MVVQGSPIPQYEYEFDYETVESCDQCGICKKVNITQDSKPPCVLPNIVDPNGKKENESFQKFDQ